MGDNKLPFQGSQKLKNIIREKSLVFLIFLSFLTSLVIGIIFIVLMERIMLNNAGLELMKNAEIERLRLEAAVNGEIAIVLNMANSPLIRRYFSNPGDPDMEKLVFEELAAYRMVSSANSIFWINDIDKIFYFNDFKPYIIDPFNPDNYWYNMTLHETGVYNFNINHNPDLNVTNLWINAPVFDNEGNPLGIVGTGMNLSDFINEIYLGYSQKTEIYFFNAAREITGSRNVDLVSRKGMIEDELGQIGMELLEKKNDLERGEIKYFQTKQKRGVAVLGSIPALDWYIATFQYFKISDILKTGMTVLFTVLMLVMKIVVFSVFAVHQSKLAKGRAEAAKEAIMSSIEYASRIQKSLLPPDSEFKEAFSDYSIIWKPRDIVGGDIYWIKNFDNGTLLCVCDCTGHGTPGALLTMLVVSAFEAAVTADNCQDTAQVIWDLDKRFTRTLNTKIHNDVIRGLDIRDGCDLAVFFIAKDGNVAFSSSHTHVFICDGNSVQNIKGQKIFIGEGKLPDKNEIKTTHIPANPNNKFYIASDGLFDQPGGESNTPFGYDVFMRIILENHNADQTFISEKIWEGFEKYRKDVPRVDDFELISFIPFFK